MRDRSPLLALLIGCVLAFGIIFGAHTVDKVNSQQVACQQVNALRGAIVTVLRNGESAAPHNPYFKAHPDQLREALTEYERDIQKLQPISC